MVAPQLDELGAFIRDQRERSALSLRKLAAQAGVSNPYLSQIERGLRKPSAEILMAIARALQIRTEALYERAGLIDPAERDDVTAAIEGDAQLTKTHKEALLEIYKSFISEDTQEER